MDSPDLTLYYAVHVALRDAADRLATAAATLDPADRRRVRAFARYWAGYVGELHDHHTIEDDFFFPALAERVEAARVHMARLADDHRVLDELVADAANALAGVTDGAASPAALGAILRELAAHMRAHLDLEDAEILPLFERHFSAAEYRAVDEPAVKSVGVGRQTLFTVPFIARAIAPEARAEVLAGVPAVFRVVYRITRGRHERLRAAAFGPALVEVS
jgi:hemerythrin-like domain-containing protein